MFSIDATPNGFSSAASATSLTTDLPDSDNDRPKPLDVSRRRISRKIRACLEGASGVCTNTRAIPFAVALLSSLVLNALALAVAERVYAPYSLSTVAMNSFPVSTAAPALDRMKGTTQ